MPSPYDLDGLDVGRQPLFAANEVREERLDRGGPKDVVALVNSGPLRHIGADIRVDEANVTRDRKPAGLELSNSIISVNNQDIWMVLSDPLRTGIPPLAGNSKPRQAIFFRER